MSNNKIKPTYCTLSHLWGILTAPNFHASIELDEMDELSQSEIRQALCDVLQIYIDYTELFVDENEWDCTLGQDSCWDYALESFYDECVRDKFNIFENDYNVNIKDWKYWHEFIAERGVKKPVKLSDITIEVPTADKEELPVVENVSDMIVSVQERFTLTGEQKTKLHGLLTDVRCKEESNLETDIDHIKPKTKEEFEEIFNSSTLKEVAEMFISLWGKYEISLHRGGNESDLGLELTTIEGVSDVWCAEMMDCYL